MLPSAFVLGNGPTLPPIDVLDSLRGQLTVGTTRILLSGFEPTAIIVADLTVFNESTDDGREYKQALLDTDAIVMVTAGLQPLGKNWAHLAHGEKSEARDRHGRIDPRGHVDRLVLAGNTGTAAARWLRLFADHVYLTGCSATYAQTDDGEKQTNFYGVNDYHTDVTLQKLRREKLHLGNEFPDSVTFTDDPSAWVLSPPTGQAELRAMVRAALSSCKWGPK